MVCVGSTDLSAATIALHGAYELHPQVAIRPEPFGALAYHYGTRRLVFLRKREVVDVVQGLSTHRDLSDTFEACGIAEHRWPTFIKALASLASSEIIRARTP
jgi:putative mycofactocin binding protein MftB